MQLACSFTFLSFTVCRETQHRHCCERKASKVVEQSRWVLTEEAEGVLEGKFGASGEDGRGGGLEE